MAKELDVLLSDELNEVALEQEKDVVGVQVSQLLVYNDDFNTFDWVIQCFMEVCNHTFEQSEQLSLIVHYKGKAVVKTGEFDLLKPMKDALVERGLSAVIEVTVQE
ncbi:MAG: ATP-dependent Clp protease adaptor ClpS [Saprospiraceae bacterium]